MARKCDVLIVGAGPVGAMTGLLLAKRGVSVVIIEKEPKIVPSPRALLYHRQNIPTLEEAGILEDVRGKGTTLKEGVRWRRLADHALLATTDFSVLKSDDPLSGPYYDPILLGQHIFEEIVLGKLQATDAQLLWGYSFQSLEQTDARVTINTTDSNGKEHQFSASFIVGTDGARSGVRHAIGVPYEGFTHDLNFMAVNFRYPQIHDTGFGYVEFICDPAEKIEDSDFGLVIYTGRDGVWRCAYGDAARYNEDELKARVPIKLKKLLPLQPDEGQYEILQAQPYHVHQRCAASYVKGRVLLAGDAAHANNPAGGLGLNAGLLDARVVADIIPRALKLSDEAEVDRALQEYNDIRREGFLGFTNPASIENLRRLWEASEEADIKLRDEYFASMKDPAFQREIQLSANKMAIGIGGL